MLQALLAGVASVKAQQTRMNVIGNNLANVNTTAYKSSRVTFQDMISQTIQGATRPGEGNGGTNPIQYGLGVSVGSTDVNNEQGSLGATNRPSDLAIQGNGYFMVPSGDGVAYTRDGSFDLDANGDLVQTSTGNRLLGWTADSQGKIDTSLPITGTSKLNIPIGKLNAVQATTTATMKGNLSADADPTATYTAQMTVYDSLGGTHQVTVQFSNHTAVDPTTDPKAPASAKNSWDWTAYEGDRHEQHRHGHRLLVQSDHQLEDLWRRGRHVRFRARHGRLEHAHGARGGGGPLNCRSRSTSAALASSSPTRRSRWAPRTVSRPAPSKATTWGPTARSPASSPTA